MSISYDGILEGVFYDELMGVRKQKESILGVIRGFFGCFGGKGRCGTIAIDFGVPISLSVGV